jgi:hypothetical protein
MLLVLNAFDVYILLILLSVGIVDHSLHSSLNAAFQQIFFLLAPQTSRFWELFVWLATIGLVKPCRRRDLCDGCLLNPCPLVRVGHRAHHVFLTSGVPYRWTCSSLGIGGLAFMILLADGFKLSLERILMCLLIQSQPNWTAYHLAASTDVRLREFDQLRPLLALVV